MFKINDYVVYKKDVCKIIDVKEKQFNNQNYFVLAPIDDNSLKIDVPVDNRCGYLRELITKDEVQKIIQDIPNIEIIKNNDKMIETEYRNLLNSNKHRDLIKIIKTTYLRNKERLDSNKKVRDKDLQYFELAEKYLYNEFSIVLNLTYEETKNFVITKVLELIDENNS